MTDRLDSLDENSYISELKQLREDLNEIKNDQFIRRNKFNIEVSGTANVPAYDGTLGGGKVIIPHNLGYIPIPFVFYTDGITYFQMPLHSYTSSFAVGGINYVGLTSYIYASTDSVNLYINTITTTAGGGTPATTVKYYLLRESAAG